MAKKNRIPKKIAGVKIPRAIRKNTLMKGLLGNPVGRQIIADALIAAASAAAAALVASRHGAVKVASRHGAVKKAGKAVANAGEDTLQVARGALKSAASAFTDSLSNAAKLAVGDDDRSRRKHARAH
jgi:hypothetical protein